MLFFGFNAFCNDVQSVKFIHPQYYINHIGVLRVGINCLNKLFINFEAGDKTAIKLNERIITSTKII